MIYKTNSSLRPKAAFIRPVATVLCMGMIGVIPLQAYSHPEPSERDLMTERKKQMSEKHEKIRAEAAERRKLQKEKSDQRRAESKRKTEKYVVFKEELLSMLVGDNVVSSDQESFVIKYSNGHPIVNDMDLTERFGSKYEALWARHDRVMSEASYMNIGPKHFEVREITQDGRSHHFSMQTG